MESTIDKFMEKMMRELPNQCSDLKFGQILGFVVPLLALSTHQIIRMIYMVTFRVRTDIWPRVWPRLSVVILDTALKGVVIARTWFNQTFPPL